MTTKTSNGIKATGYMVENPNFIKKGEYKRTLIDDEKDSVDFLITFVGDTRYEIIFKRPTILKTNRSIIMDGKDEMENRMYWVTEKALKKLQKEYTWTTDF